MPGVGIIRNEGIIRGRVLYEKMRYMFFLLYALCWMVFCWFLFCSTIKPILSIFRVESVQVEEAIGKIVSILSFITQEYVRNTTFCKQTCVGRWSKKGIFRWMLYCCMLFWWVLFCCILFWQILFGCMLYWWILFCGMLFFRVLFCCRLFCWMFLSWLLLCWLLFCSTIKQISIFVHV